MSMKKILLLHDILCPREKVFSISDVTHLIYEPFSLSEMERGALINALAYFDGDQIKAAQALHLTPRVLRYKLKQHAIPHKRRENATNR